ncbi:MAG: glycosyltransferase family 2 protein [Spirochaetaceae bacterium]|nr:glycosyltransferase family 2 protein [Spirochaetaceae bacterium]
MDVSVIIVNYNTKDLLRNCLESVFTQTQGIQFEVIVSDNGSEDGSQDMVRELFPQVILIENNANLGFGSANNRGLDHAQGKYIFYLNSDTVLLNNAVKIFFDYWENFPDKESLGALGANLLDADMEVIHSYGTFPGYRLSLVQLFSMLVSNGMLSLFQLLHVSPAFLARGIHRADFFVGAVDYVTGADLFLLNDANARFDEDFFLYFEEADLQRRIAAQGKIRLVIDGPLIQHLCGGSVDESISIKRKGSFSRIQFEISRIRFLKKYGNNPVLHCLVKGLVTLLWINPFLIKNTGRYIPEIWKI